MNRPEVRRNEFSSDVFVPAIRPAFQSRPILRPNHAGRTASDVGQAQKDALHGVIQRTNHAGDVMQGGPLDASFANRTGRFALEIDDDEGLACKKKLSQVVVAMAPDSQAPRTRGQ